jgi:hypothetical protein
MTPARRLSSLAQLGEAREVPALRGSQKNMGVASRVADYAQIPALHEGRGMVAGREVNVQPAERFPPAT